MLRSYLLLFMAQGSLALTCYNSTRVTESHKIEYKSHETSEQACADACTANDKCIAYLSNENGGRFECVQFGPAKEIMCTLPIFINMKVACSPILVGSSLCSPYPSVLPAEETYDFNTFRLPKSITCVSNNCTCPPGKIMLWSADIFCMIGVMVEWRSEKGYWYLHGTLAENSWSRIGSWSLGNLRCETLSKSLHQVNYNFPIVHRGYYGEKKIVCPKGLDSIDTVNKGNAATDPNVLHSTDGRGFVFDNADMTYAICNK